MAIAAWPIEALGMAIVASVMVGAELAILALATVTVALVMLGEAAVMHTAGRGLAGLIARAGVGAGRLLPAFWQSGGATAIRIIIPSIRTLASSGTAMAGSMPVTDITKGDRRR